MLSLWIVGAVALLACAAPAAAYNRTCSLAGNVPYGTWPGRPCPYGWYVGYTTSYKCFALAKGSCAYSWLSTSGWENRGDNECLPGECMIEDHIDRCQQALKAWCPSSVTTSCWDSFVERFWFTTDWRSGDPILQEAAEPQTAETLIARCREFERDDMASSTPTSFRGNFEAQICNAFQNDDSKQPCGNNARCTPSSDSGFTCDCPAGMLGFRCDIDPSDADAAEAAAKLAAQNAAIGTGVGVSIGVLLLIAVAFILVRRIRMRAAHMRELQAQEQRCRMDQAAAMESTPAPPLGGNLGPPVQANTKADPFAGGVPLPNLHSPFDSKPEFRPTPLPTQQQGWLGPHDQSGWTASGIDQPEYPPPEYDAPPSY